MSDYQPFGKINYDNKLIDLKSDYTFTGQEYDEENSLQYYGARYMDNEIGRFTSVDPAVLRLDKRFAKALTDPQQLNSYSYTANNPLKYTDEKGEFLFVPILLAAYVVANTIWDLGNVALSSYFFSKDQSSANAAGLSMDMYALSNPLIFGGVGVVNTVKNVNEANNINELNKANELRNLDEINDVVKLRHVAENNASSIKINGFNQDKEIWTLNIDDMNSLGVSGKYSQDRFQNGQDPGHIDINLPRNIYNNFLNKRTIIERRQNGAFGPYNEIIIKPEVAPTLNKYIQR